MDLVKNKNMEKLIKNTISHEAFFMVNKVMLKYLGSANAAIILSGFISKHDYFQKRNEIVDGFFYNTKEMIMQETGMSEAAILRAEKLLESKGLIRTQLRGLPRVKHYAVQWDQIERILHNEGSVTAETQVAQPTKLSVRNVQDNSGNDTQEQHPITIINNNNKNNKEETRVMGRVPKNRSLHSNPTVSQSLELAGVSSIDEYFDKWDD